MKKSNEYYNSHTQKFDKSWNGEQDIFWSDLWKIDPMLSKNHKEIEMMERVCIVGFDTYHTALEGILFTYT